jgi:hypothetical protein
MKNQYVGDRRDLFKYDLLIDLAGCLPDSRLVFIPMLTPNDGTGKGSFTKYDCGTRRRLVYEFLRNAVASGKRNTQLLRDLMPTCGVQFMPSRNADYFHDANRTAYFDAVPSDWLARSVIFLDPDIGFQTGRASYMRRNGCEKYLMYTEASKLAARASDDSILVVYQHLQNDATKRADDLKRRLCGLTTHLGASCGWTIQWADLAFLVAVRDRALAARVAVTLRMHAGRHNGSLFVEGIESDYPDARGIAGTTTMGKTLPPMPPLARNKTASTLPPLPAKRGNRTTTVGLDEIVRFLNEEQIRATYGAVADIVGGIPQAIGERLGGLADMRPEASWVVNASSGMPTGYLPHQRHPALLSKTEIIKSGSELRRRLDRWKGVRPQS